MVAVMNGKTDVVKELLELGADIEAKDNVSGGNQLLFSENAGL